GVRQVIHCVSSAGHRLGGRRPDIEGSSRQNLRWRRDHCDADTVYTRVNPSTAHPLYLSFALATKPHQEALMVTSRHTDRSVSTSSLQQPERSRQAGHGQSRY
ncbi:hypothetical protein RRG08_046415, partial [Elysia crispata]